MLPYEEALIHARQHLHSVRRPVEHVWVLRDGKRWDEGWYFTYRPEPRRFIENIQRFGGAPGFLVKDDGTIEVIGWSDPRQEKYRAS